MKTFKTISGILLLLVLLFSAGCTEVESTNDNDVHIGNNGPVKGDPPVDTPPPTGPMGFEKTEHDFGTIVSGDSVVAVYPFTNNTVTQLEIERFYTSCACISAVGPDHPLEPGEKSEVTVTFRSNGQPIARYEKIVSIAFVGKEGYLLPLRLNGQVVN